MIARLKAWNRRRKEAKRPPTLSLIVREREIVCPCCKRTVNCWRKYVDGRKECIPCADKRRK